jgi:hypothetical protein
MTDAERLSLAHVPHWCDYPAPLIEKWITANGRLPTTDDKPPGARRSMTDAHKLKLSEANKTGPRKRLWAKWREKGPVKYGTGRREA